jgi:hypothetical protein
MLRFWYPFFLSISFLGGMNNAHAINFCEIFLTTGKYYEKLHAAEDRRIGLRRPFTQIVLEYLRNDFYHSQVHSLEKNGDTKIVVLLGNRIQTGDYYPIDETEMAALADHIITDNKSAFLNSLNQTSDSKVSFLYEGFKHGSTVRFLQKAFSYSGLAGTIGISSILTTGVLKAGGVHIPDGFLVGSVAGGALSAILAATAKTAGTSLGTREFTNYNEKWIRTQVIEPAGNHMVAYYVSSNASHLIQNNLKKMGFILENPTALIPLSYYGYRF